MMQTKQETQNWRYSVVGMFFAVFALLIIGKIILVQFDPKAQGLREKGDLYIGEWRTVYPPRGLIYDRWGRLLAGNQTVYEVGVELKDVTNPQTIAVTLSNVLGIDYATTLAAASMEYSTNPTNPAVYVVLADFVTEEDKQKIEQFGDELSTHFTSRDKDKNPPSLRGLIFTAHLERSYPEGELGSNLIGFVNRTGDGFGVEKQFNDLLAGTPQNIWVPLDPNRVEEINRPPAGTSLILTIDREIQTAMEEILDDAIEETGSEGGTIVVTDPRTGEIMAMATTPRLDLNRYWEYEEIFPNSTPFNKAVSQAYEPGSVFKVLTMAAAMDAGIVEPTTPFLDQGYYEIGGLTIYNWNLGAWGPVDMLGCMQHSLNVCLAWIADEMGENRFYTYMANFGFGHTTGIELAGENSGRLKLPGDRDWYEADLGTNSFGQGISVTPVQMAMAISAVANDGRMLAPHIVRSVITNGRQYDTPVQVLGTPIKPETARALTDMLAISLETESSDALVEGYRVAGKTGTAEIPTETGYSSSQTHASFVGWGPADDPRFLVYVWLEKPSTSQWGSVVAAPVFREAVEKLVILINLPPDDVRFNLMAANSP